MLVFGFAYGLYAVNLWTTTFDVIGPAARATATSFLNVSTVVVTVASPLVGYGKDHRWFCLGEIFPLLSVIAAIGVIFLILNIVYFIPRDYRGPLE